MTRTLNLEVAETVAKSIDLDCFDVTSTFTSCDSRMVKQGLEQGFTMLALPLRGFHGKIGSKTFDADGSQLPRLGRELAGAAKLAGVRGVFHSDELPAYGIEDGHVDKVRADLELTSNDAFVLCLAPDWQAQLALESVGQRARQHSIEFHKKCVTLLSRKALLMMGLQLRCGHYQAVHGCTLRRIYPPYSSRASIGSESLRIFPCVKMNV